MDVLHLWGICIVINRVNYRLYGPLYRNGERWTAYKPGKNYAQDPDFTLLRENDITRQGTHAAYRKAVDAIESAVNLWAPGEREIAALAIPVIQEYIQEQEAKVGDLRKDPRYQTEFGILLRVQEDYLAKLYQDLRKAQLAFNAR
jgi:hypothetical protein